MSRAPEERDRDRADVLEVLRRATYALTTRQAIRGLYAEPITTAQETRDYARVYADLRLLARRGEVIWDATNGVSHAVWRLATPEALSAIEDRAEVARMEAQWEDA